MFNLKLDDIPEEGLTLKWKEERPTLISYMKGLSQIDFDFETPLQSEAKIVKLDRSVFIKGSVQTELRLQCVRCLKDFSYPLFSTFELTLHPLKEAAKTEEKELVDEEMESNFFEGGELHLSEIAYEQIFLEIPYKPLCHETCKGLCPVCGKDLNRSPCGCTKEVFSSAFSELEKIKLEESKKIR